MDKLQHISPILDESYHHNHSTNTIDAAYMERIVVQSHCKRLVGLVSIVAVFPLPEDAKLGLYETLYSIVSVGPMFAYLYRE
jgi:hypothetical protein